MNAPHRDPGGQPHGDPYSNWAGAHEYMGHRPGTRTFTPDELRARDEAIIRETLQWAVESGVSSFVFDTPNYNGIIAAAEQGDTP